MNTQRTWPVAVVATFAAAFLTLASSAAADTWNERTKLTFSEPVMIPGATLQPGTYIFQLADTRGSRHMVRVFESDGREPVALTQAVPIRRLEPRDATVLTFNPTDRGMPALKAWYYPNSVYGHEFIYSEDEARHIAERSRSIVLSVDVEDTDLEKGTIRVYHPGGQRREWRPDPDTTREWEAWQRNRAVVRTDPSTGNGDDDDDDDEGRRSTAPIMMTDATGTRVELDDLESTPSMYIGKKVTVDAEVEEVFGPRLFTIDEPHWGDLDGEIVVYAPSALAALVSDDDRITVTGTLKTVAIADIEREWGWFELDPDIEVDFLKKPVLVAERVVGGNNDKALFLEMPSRDPSARSGSGWSTTIMDAGLVGAATSDLVGRHVDLKNVHVLRAARGGGFFVDLRGNAVLVLPTRTMTISVAAGDVVSLQGAIADMPKRTIERVNPPAGWNDQIYVVATHVSK